MHISLKIGSTSPLLRFLSTIHINFIFQDTAITLYIYTVILYDKGNH